MSSIEVINLDTSEDENPSIPTPYSDSESDLRKEVSIGQEKAERPRVVMNVGVSTEVPLESELEASLVENFNRLGKALGIAKEFSPHTTCRSLDQEPKSLKRLREVLNDRKESFPEFSQSKITALYHKKYDQVTEPHKVALVDDFSTENSKTNSTEFPSYSLFPSSPCVTPLPVRRSLPKEVPPPRAPEEKSRDQLQMESALRMEGVGFAELYSELCTLRALQNTERKKEVEDLARTEKQNYLWYRELLEVVKEKLSIENEIFCKNRLSDDLSLSQLETYSALLTECRNTLQKSKFLLPSGVSTATVTTPHSPHPERLSQGRVADITLKKITSINEKLHADVMELRKKVEELEQKEKSRQQLDNPARLNDILVAYKKDSRRVLEEVVKALGREVVTVKEDCLVLRSTDGSGAEETIPIGPQRRSVPKSPDILQPNKGTDEGSKLVDQSFLTPLPSLPTSESDENKEWELESLPTLPSSHSPSPEKD